MFKRLLLLSSVILIGYGQASSAAPAAQDASKSGGEVPAHVKKIYAIDCALCHGADGSGKSDMATDMKLNLIDWTDPKSLAGKSDQELFDTIRKGKDKMPAEDEGRAKNDDVHHLILYIRGMSKGQPSPAAMPAPAAPATASAAPAPGTR